MTLPPRAGPLDDRPGEPAAHRGVAAFGFTERQARFLVNVLLHSGYWSSARYLSFAGIVHGQKTRTSSGRSSSGDSRRRSRRESSIAAGCSTSTTSRSGRLLVAG